MDFKKDGISPNAGRLLWAGFMAILAAGVGFGVRGGILEQWRSEFGFTDLQIGMIGGAGLTGFCFGIIVGGVVCDKIGYGKLVAGAFLTHVVSAFLALWPGEGTDPEAAYSLLYWGAFIFAYANGTLEAVANPLVAKLFPTKRTHYLNILHASWPAGLVLGGCIGWFLGEGLDWSWKMQLSLFLVPTVLYGIMFMGQEMPKSEASQRGLSLGDMFKDVGILGGVVICFLLTLFFSQAMGLGAGWSYGIAGVLLLIVAVITNFSIGSWLLFTLFIVHGLVGSVELGTDTWAQNITGNILTPEQGKILFVFTSLIMFSLRFCADFIQRVLGLSPMGILLTCAVLACLGLNLASGIDTFSGAMLALGVYAIGKTFFWPTMLAVASDRFPQTGAIAISIMGGIGMLAGGLIGSQGLGYAKDRYAGAALEAANPAVYAAYKADKTSSFLIFEERTGLDGTKLGEVKDKLGAARKALADGADPKTAMDQLSADERVVIESSIEGDRKTLIADSFIPGLMAIIYLLLLVYFKSIGGYKAVDLVTSENPAQNE